MSLDAGTRTGPVAITDGSKLAEVWPQAAQALRAYLRSRGASPQDADDLVQECAVRVLRSRPTFIDAPDLLRWCLPVVRNLSVDLHRRGRHELPVESVPDRQGGDVAETVLVSLELLRVLRALEKLRPSDRDAIVANVEQEQGGSLDRKQAVRLNVQRHRARQRLLARLAAVLGICAAFGRRMVRVAGPAALPVALAVALLTTVMGASAGRVAPRSTPGPTSVALAHGPVSAATAADLSTQLQRPSAASVGFRRKPAARPVRQKVTVVAVTTRQGVGARLSEGKPKQPGTLVCVRDVEPLPDVCIPQLQPKATPSD
jgi:hypothetical protein